MLRWGQIVPEVSFATPEGDGIEGQAFLAQSLAALREEREEREQQLDLLSVACGLTSLLWLARRREN